MKRSSDNETNMISMFCDDDREFSIPGDLSMKTQIEEFDKNVKYSKLDVDIMRKNHDLSILKKDTYLSKLIDYE